MEPALDLERFAALSAELEAGASKDELCAREGISVGALTSAQELWLGKMAEEAARKRFELTNRYNAAFVARRRALDGGKRGGRGTSARATSEASKAAPARPASAPAPVAPPPIAPAVMSAPPMISPPPPIVAEAPPMIAAPPPMIAAPPPITAALPPMVAAPPPEEYGHATADGPSPFSLPRDPLPFKPGAPVIEMRAAGPKIVAKQEFTGTMDGEVISPFAKGTPLPFGAKDQPPPAPPPKKRPAPAETVALPVFTDEMIAQGQDPGSMAMGPTASPLRAKSNPLPFKPSADGAPPSIAAPASSTHAGGLPFKASAPTGSVSTDAPTAPIAPLKPAAPESALPFRGSPSVAPPSGAPMSKPSPSSVDGSGRTSRFTVEQFASLSVEIAMNPASVAQVRARYGLDEASHRAETEGWNRRFSADKELYARYGALFQSYRDWLSKQGR